ncbi:MAG: PAS domain S-box protein [Melioribacteraceae bacterium]|nr:MAG: PAS domain S-box protein [Melioribacteraceae bacterium]
MPFNRFADFKKTCIIRNFILRFCETLLDRSYYNPKIYDLQYKHLIEISPEPIFILKSDKIIYLNNSAKKLLAIDKTHQIQGQSIIDFVDQDYRQVAQESIYNLIKNNEDTLIAEVKLKKLTGELCYVQGLAVGIVYNDNSAVLTMLRDITQIKEKEDLLRKAKEEAEKAENLKSQFLAQMSHEIRSPLNTILTSIQMFKEDLMLEENDGQNKYFNVIKSASSRIIRTIDLNLISSELQKQLYKPIYRNLDLFLITNSLIYEYRASATNKNIYLNFVCECNNPSVNADEYSVTQILSNLIDNAIKYTDVGRVDVLIYCESDDRIIIEVKDSGRGISEGFLNNIFCEFSQEDFGYNRKYEGTGLGMTIVKKFCDLNKAEIKIESKLNKGTSVFIIFDTAKKSYEN